MSSGPALLAPPLAPLRPRLAATTTARRPLLIVAGDLNNLGDLALLLVNLDHARRDGRTAFVRQWGPLPDQIVRQVEAAGGRIVDGRALGAILRRGAACDLLIGGGQLVRQNVSLRALTYLALLASAVRLGGGRIETRGLGVSETTGLRHRLWQFILAPCTTLNLRDEASLARARRLLPRADARLTADMVLTADLARHAARSGPGPAIVVALCEDASEGRGVAGGALHMLLAAARKRWPGVPIRAVVHDLRPGTDREFLTRTLQGEADVLVDDAGGGLAELLTIYRDAAVVITNRLHAGLFAISFGRPVVVLDDGNDKLDVLHERAGAARVDLRGSDIDADAVLGSAVAGAGLSGEAIEALRGAARRNLSSGAETAIFNVKFSPNLGDGLIAECLENALRTARAELHPRSVDLAGRKRYDPQTGRGRRRLLRVLDVLPTVLRAKAVPSLLALYARTLLRPKWRRQLLACDSVVIGGGALLADADQNFPVKLSAVLRLCAELKRPVAIAHVGVTPGWSEGGLARFSKALRRVRLLKVTVRDRESLGHFRSEFGSIGPDPELALDPGLLCCDTYGSPPARRTTHEQTRIGLCLTEPMILELHGQGGLDTDRYSQWVRAVIERLVDQHGGVALFTNGSPEDDHFASTVFQSVRSLGGVEFVARHTQPGDLARYISGLDCVVAHRLHACIAAYSYAVPAVGLSWDKKLDRFFDVVGRGQYVVDWRGTSPGTCATLVTQALADPIDPVAHAETLARCRAGVAELADCLVREGKAA